jgi:hypothetical protein
MKYLIFVLAACLAAAGLYSFFSEDEKPSPEMLAAIDKERNLFIVALDSNDIVWQRANLFFKERGYMLGSNETVYSDTLIVNDYYNEYRKDMYLAVRRKVVADKVIFKVTAGDHGKDDPDFEKEIALYIRTGKNRFKLK